MKKFILIECEEGYLPCLHSPKLYNTKKEAEGVALDVLRDAYPECKEIPSYESLDGIESECIATEELAHYYGDTTDLKFIVDEVVL